MYKILYATSQSQCFLYFDNQNEAMDFYYDRSPEYTKEPI